jgi:ribonucleoside-diphosphate reductase beta chain
MEEILSPKKLWNPNGDSALDESLIGGNPTGMLNFNDSRYKWADGIFKQMLENTWFPEEVDTSNEKKSYDSLLTDQEKRMYDRVFSQLSFNDSLQAENLVDNINQYITNKVVNACLTRQAFEEVLHSKSYAVLLSDAVEDNTHIFNLFKEDLTLRAKNEIIASNYSKFSSGEITKEKLFYAMVANQILEGVYFLSGFSAIYHLSDKMRGSADMIAFIHRDEETHLALFQNMIKTFIKENPDEPYFIYRNTVNKMFDEAYHLEVSWMKYIFEDVLPDHILEATVAYFIKKRARAIGMYDEEEDRYSHGVKTTLVKKLESFGNFNDTRTNFFEGNVKNYSKGSLVFDEDWADYDLNTAFERTYTKKEPKGQLEFDF